MIAPASGVYGGADPLADNTSRFFVQATIIIGICRFLAIFGNYLGQPSVIFEIIGGILLGPTVIGQSEYFNQDLFNSTSLTYLQLIANIGLTFYLFIVGMELDPQLLKSHIRQAGGIALVGMIVPFVLGIGISQTLIDNLQENDGTVKNSYSGFFVFIGTAMSITAFPVLARILKESGLIYTAPGALVLGAAAINDAIAWCLLILAISIANAQDMATAGYVFATVVLFGLFMLLVFRPLFAKLVRKVEDFHNGVYNGHLFALTVCVMLVCAWTTALLGVHVIFGAFIFGLTVPRNTHLFKQCNEKIEHFVLNFFLPIYFALSGIQTNLTTINTPSQGVMILLVCFIASIGKFIGAGTVAYLTGHSLRETATIAVLMNTRGLIELIVLNLGLSSHILNTRTFSVMVIMCLFTTFITSPLVALIYPPSVRVMINKSKNELLHKARAGIVESSVGEITSIEKTAKDLRLFFVVDSLQQLQSLMDLVFCFQPVAQESSLQCTSVKFMEPQFNHQDEFLGLNEAGKLIRIDQERTDTMGAKYDHLPPLTLPLSMLCRSIGSKIKAYQVIGDPNEFPEVLTNMSVNIGADMILVPWRKHSEYFERLIWGFLNCAEHVVGLLVQSAQYHTDPTRVRDGTLDTDENQTFSDVPAESEKAAAASDEFGAVRDIMAVVRGRPADLHILAIVLRFAENSGLNITVTVCGDIKLYPRSVRHAVKEFGRKVNDSSNVKIVFLKHVDGRDPLAVHKETSKYPARLAIVSYLDPSQSLGDPSAVRDVEEGSQQNRGGTAARLPFIPAALTLTPSLRTDDIVEYRRLIGVPEHSVNSPLKHPELGQLGDAILKDGHREFVLIIHEPLPLSQRRKIAYRDHGLTTEHHSQDNLASQNPSSSELHSDEVQADHSSAVDFGLEV